MERKTDPHYNIVSLLAGCVNKVFPDLEGRFLGWQVHSGEEYSARRLSDEISPRPVLLLGQHTRTPHFPWN